MRSSIITHRLLAQHGAEISDLGILPDDPVASTAHFAGLGTRFDLIVTSGAVSMGGKDHICEALIMAGDRINGWRVAIKPGNPVMFGTLGDAAFTGLPGNPFAVYLGFHLFVSEQLARMTGAEPVPFAAAPACAGFDWQRKPGRAEVFPVRLRAMTRRACPSRTGLAQVCLPRCFRWLGPTA